MRRGVSPEAAILAAAWLAACSSVTSGAGPNLQVAATPTVATGSSGSLYVANAHAVTVYDMRNGALIRSVPNSDPRAIAFDRNGDLFVANEQANSVTVYARGKTSMLRVITAGLDDPNALAFDGFGNLYVSNKQSNTVTVYGPGSGSVLRTITEGVAGPHVLIFNGSSYLFVGNNGSSHITVYAPGGTHVIRTIVTRNGPLALAFNRAEYLFCANNFNITVYKSGATKPTRKITDAISLPSTLAVDGLGNLYVANWGANMFRSSISVYRPGSSSQNRNIRKGVGYPLSLAFDSSGDLYVANSGYNTVTEYGRNSSKVKRTISRGVMAPVALAVGP